MGLEVYVPVFAVRWMGGFEDRVWDAPLPNAPRSEIVVKEVEVPALRLPGRRGICRGDFFGRSEGARCLPVAVITLSRIVWSVAGNCRTCRFGPRQKHWNPVRSWLANCTWGGDF